MKLFLLALTLLLPAQVVTQTVATVPFRIACGQSASYTDSKGQVWQADADFNAGATYATGTAVTGSPDPKLYQSQRYSRTDSPALTYTIPLANGSYTLNLYFSEIYGPAATVRMFNVKANGTALLTNFNIASDAGGAFKADVKTFPVTVTNGNLIIEFDHVAGTPENPAISAIEVLPATPAQPDSITVQGQLLWCAKCDGTDNIPATGNLVVAQTGAGSTTQNILADGNVSLSSTVDVSQDPLEFVIELTDGAGNVQPGASLTLTFPKFELNSPGFLVGTITIGIVRIAHVTDADGNPAIRIVDVSAFSIGK